MIDVAKQADLQSADHIVGLLRAFVNISDASAGYLMRVRGAAYEIIHSSDVALKNQLQTPVSPFQMSLIRKALHTRKPTAILDTRASSRTGVSPRKLSGNPRTSLSIPLHQDAGASFVMVVEAIENYDSLAPTILKAAEIFCAALVALLPLNDEERNQRTTPCSDPSRDPTESDARIASGIEPAVLNGVAETIANEVNDPLSAVVSHAAAGLQWLNQDPPNLDNARNSFRKVASSAFGVGNVISSYRISQLADHGGACHISATDVLEEALQYVFADISANCVKLIKAVDPHSVVYGERRLVVQAIVSVLSASIDGLATSTDHRILTIQEGVSDSHFELRVSSNGSEAPSAARDAFFDPVYSQKSGNCGIKLAVARNIALLQGGGLEISSGSDQALTLVLKLPLQRR